MVVVAAEGHDHNHRTRLHTIRIVRKRNTRMEDKIEELSLRIEEIRNLLINDVMHSIRELRSSLVNISKVVDAQVDGRQTCSATTGDGNQCRRRVAPGKPTCEQHSRKGGTSHTHKKSSYTLSSCRAITSSNQQCRRTCTTGSRYCNTHADFESAPLLLCKICKLGAPEPGCEYCIYHNGRARQCSSIDDSDISAIARSMDEESTIEQCKNVARSGSKYCTEHADPNRGWKNTKVF